MLLLHLSELKEKELSEFHKWIVLHQWSDSSFYNEYSVRQTYSQTKQSISYELRETLSLTCDRSVSSFTTKWEHWNRQRFSSHTYLLSAPPPGTEAYYLLHRRLKLFLLFFFFFSKSLSGAFLCFIYFFILRHFSHAGTVAHASLFKFRPKSLLFWTLAVLNLETHTPNIVSVQSPMLFIQ